MNKGLFRYLLFVSVIIVAGCANITTPTGGKKDTTPPKRLSITPADSLKNTRIKKIEITFDEYITVNDAAKEVQISPLLSINPTVTGLGKKVTIKIPDTLLEPNTTYRIYFGNAIRDLHEGNPYGNYTYTFSTGAWFDSMQLRGKVLNAATGLPDSAGTLVLLYYATDGDSAIVKRKPRYIINADASGSFSFKGLPARSFKLFALKDGNDNMMYDGEGEMIAFADHDVIPGDTSAALLTMRMFIQPADTSLHPETDTTIQAHTRSGGSTAKPQPFGYTVNVDSNNKAKRTFDINKELEISFTKGATINTGKITLVADSGDIETPVPFSVGSLDTQNKLPIRTNWRENTVYTLKLSKGFAKDTSGTDAMPARFTFRTKEDEDYGKLSIHLPSKYAKGHVLQVTADNDTIYQQPVTDTTVNLSRLKPAKYVFRVIADKNGNGKWDAGNLFLKLQPEEVIPYREVLNLRAGWENVVDFEQKPAPARSQGKR